MRISDWSSDVCSSDLTDIIMGEGAYERFYANADVKELLNTNYRIGGTSADASILGQAGTDKEAALKIGRASCRERVCQDVVISGGDVSFKKQNNYVTTTRPYNNRTNTRRKQ